MSEVGKTLPCCGCDCHTAADATIQLASLIRTANEATAAIAEVARVQANTVLVVLQRENIQPRLLMAAPVLAHTKITGVHNGLAISERVGSITLAEWEGMTEEQSYNLDQALKRIVKEALIPAIDWNGTGVIIQRELAKVGFRFKTAVECPTLQGVGDWNDAENTALSDLVRVRATRNAARSCVGLGWWTDEMVRIVLRLMELRGL